jgi:RNA polymerase sigma-70 factor (ECF subfamily)
VHSRISAAEPVVPVEWIDAWAARRRRDLDALLQLAFERCRGMVHTIALRNTGDRDDADDITQNVFEILARRIHRLRDPGSIPGFLRGCAVRQSWALRRIRQRRSDKIADLGVPDARGVDRPFDAALVRQLIARLETSEKRALVLKYAAGLTHDEVALTIGASVATARRRVDAARRKLQALA